VDNARDIRDKVNLLPAKGKYKVYIIDEVHMLSDSAFNALLKTLEEPPPHIVFILATTELNALPKTVLSRCQRFDFRHIEEEDMIRRMREILGAVGKSAEDAALYEISAAAEGGLRDALTILDKCCTLTDEITLETVGEVLNYADASLVRSFLDALGGYDEKKTLSLLGAMLDGGVEPDILIGQMLELLRSMLYGLVTGAGRDQELQALAELWGKQAVLRGLEIFAETQNRMKYAVRPGILLEASVMRLLLPESETDVGALELRIQKLEKKLAVASLAAPPAAAELALPEPEKVQEKLEDSSQAGKAQPEPADGELWERIKKACGADPGFKPFLSDMVFLRQEQGRLFVTSGNATRLRMFRESGIKGEIEQIAGKLLDRTIFLEVVMPEGEQGKMQLYDRENIDIID